jgi:hypothetical protein
VEKWRDTFRRGFAPLLSDQALKALHQALITDDPRLMQGATCSPPPLAAVQDWPAEACCLVPFGAWQSEGLETVEQIEDYFARTCYAVDEALGEVAACRHLLNWFDETPRAEVRGELTYEVELALEKRACRGVAS